MDKKNSHKVNWIKKLARFGLEPSIFLLDETVSELEALELEKTFILKYKQNGLTNGTEGGEFCRRGSKISDEARFRMRQKGLLRVKDKNPMWGRKHSEKTKQKQSAIAKKNKLGLDNPRAKPIFEYDEHNNIIKKWDYGKQCAKHYGISTGNLCLYSKLNSLRDSSFKKLKGRIFKDR